MDAATATGSTREKQEASSLERSSELCRHRFRLGDPTVDASEAAAISNSDAPHNSTRITPGIERRCVAAIWAVALASILIRLPAVIHQPGGQDEDYFAVAGWSLLQTGVPRIPYAPSLNIHGVFYKANEVLYALPPGFFAAEAVVFRIVGPSYAAGRLTSLLAGATAVVGVFWLTRRWFSASSALVAATIFAFSRPFLFPATTARPDMLCTALLIWSLVLLASGRSQSPGALEAASAGQGTDVPRSRWRTLVAGLLIGLALLTHPFALLGLILAVGWIVITPSDRKRLQLLLFLAGAAAVMALWLPLIAKDPALFRTQFGNNVLQRAGPGLLARIFWPWETLWYHAKLFLELAGPWQSALFGTSLVAATMLELRSERRRRDWLLMTWISVFGLAILQGVHPSKGYWSFPAVFLCMAAARVVDAFGRWKPAAILLSLPLLVPGGGWKAAGVYLRHWGDPDYSHPEAVQRLFDELPAAKARYLVDVGCVFDWHLSGRRTLLALDLPQYYSSAGEPFDFLVVTRTGLEQQLPRKLGPSQRILAFGKLDDDLAVYVEVWKR